MTMTREEFGKMLDAFSEAFPPNPEELQKGIAKAQDRLVKEYMQNCLNLQLETPWIPENEPYKLKILEDLGESEEIVLNEETSTEELTTVHKYRVKKVE
jgi:hypothetical protein